MANLAIELNDAALAVVDGGAVLLCEPGVAAVVGGEMRFGGDAARVARLFPRQANRRYWHRLDEVALAQPLAGSRTAADLVHAHLARLWERRPSGCESAVLAVPAYWTTGQLALLLGICRDVGLGVAGLVDSAVAASRRPYPDADVWHVEASLHDICLTRVAQGGGASIGTRHSLEQTGIESLERACAEFIARHFVTATRFDPLHDAVSEQAIYDRLGEWLAALSRKDSVDLSIDYRGQSFTTPVTAMALREVVGRALQPVIQKLRALLPARSTVILQVHHRLTEIPGLLDELGRLPGCVVVALEPAAAARGALRWRGRPTEPGAARLLTELPWDQAPGELPGSEGVAAGTAPAGAPTHVLFEGRAYRLGTTPLQIGTELNDGEYGVQLGSRVPGASRRHCTLRLEDGRAMVYDQSRFGTLLNGHRIEGSAVLRSGDLIGIGQPARELQLIAEVTDGGT